MKILTQDFLNFINENAFIFINYWKEENINIVDNCFNWKKYLIDKYLNENKETPDLDNYENKEIEYKELKKGTYKECLDYIIRSIADYL